MGETIPQGKIDDVLADPRVEFDQDDWVCVPYDDLYDLRERAGVQNPEERNAMNGVERIAAERQRQIDQEGYTPEHDDEHDFGCSVRLPDRCLGDA